MIGKISSAIMHISRRLWPPKPKHIGLRIGRIESVLGETRSILLRPNGRGMSVQSFSSCTWKDGRGHLVVDPVMEPNPHIVIVGMSGFGKSTLFKSMLLDIKEMAIPAIIFDAHNEHESLVRHLDGRAYDPSLYSINLLELNGLTKQQRISELVSLLRDVYSLGQIQATKLGQCLGYTYRNAESCGKVPTMQDLLHEISIFIKNSRTASEMNSLMHLREKIAVLGSSALGKGQISIDALGNGISSFSLAGLKSPEARIIYIHELLRRIYLSMKQNQKEKGLRLFIMVDEAQFLLGSQRETSTVRSMVEEGRKYGVGIVIATHISSNLDRQVLSNASTLISFYPRDPTEVNYISSAMSGGDPIARQLVRRRLSRLGQNEAIVVSGLHRSPVVVSTVHASELPAPGPSAPIPDMSGPVGYDMLSSAVGAPAASKMVEDGIISMEKVSTGSGSTDMVMRKRGKSIEHEMCVANISQRLSQLGIRHYVMNNSKGPDIVAYMDGGRAAIEYETGRKGMEDTVRMLGSRVRNYQRTIVFVNSAHYNDYKARLAAERVEVLDVARLWSFTATQIGI